ncbi:MAG TPA: type IV pilin protein [Xanthomonadaceae bacterium]|nr:type IV pilin protein [Xanthomonadaceae bacterium]
MARQRGFTLIELMVVVAVIAILAIIAVSSYSEQVHKSRRADVANYIGQLQLSLERWRAENPVYCNSAVGSCITYTISGTYPTVLTSYPASPANSYYTVAIAYANAQPYYTLTATPIASSAQKNDRCGVLCVYPPGSTATATCGTTKPLWANGDCN